MVTLLGRLLIRSLVLRLGVSRNNGVQIGGLSVIVLKLLLILIFNFSNPTFDMYSNGGHDSDNEVVTTPPIQGTSSVRDGG